jgi:hypothetical protein
MARLCPFCGGECGGEMTRAPLDSNDSHVAHWIGNFNLVDKVRGTNTSEREQQLIEAARRPMKTSTSRHRYYSEDLNFCATPPANRVISDDGRHVGAFYIVYELDDEDSDVLRWAIRIWDSGSGDLVLETSRSWKASSYSGESSGEEVRAIGIEDGTLWINSAAHNDNRFPLDT